MALDPLFMSLSSCTKKSSTTRIPPSTAVIVFLGSSLFGGPYLMCLILGGLCAQLLGGIFSAAQLFGRSVPCPTVIFHLQCGLKRICHRLWGGYEPLCRNWLCEASVGSQPWERITRLAFLTPSLPPAVQLLWSTSRRRGSVSSVTHALHVPDFQSGDMTPPPNSYSIPHTCYTVTHMPTGSPDTPDSHPLHIHPSRASSGHVLLKCTHLQSNFNLIISA